MLNLQLTQDKSSPSFEHLGLEILSWKGVGGEDGYGCFCPTEFLKITLLSSGNELNTETESQSQQNSDYIYK